MKASKQVSREGVLREVRGRGRVRGKNGERANGISAHEQVYQILRHRLLTGGILPGRPVTLRGIARHLETSPMPVREAVRRLIAERALEMQDNRRVWVPEMSREKFGQIVFARTQLETELALRALPNIDAAALAEIDQIDAATSRAMMTGDIEGYMDGDYQFHFAIFRRAKAETLIALTESLWLQFQPFMRLAYARIGTAGLKDRHGEVRRALRMGKPQALAKAIGHDTQQGMRMIGEAALEDPSDIEVAAACEVERS